MARHFLSQHKHSIVFVSLLVLVSLHYNIHRILPRKPMGSHVWRQTDCASLAYNYYQNGMNPFKPQVHNQLGDNGYGISEFPILYYTVAVLYKIFGPHEFIFRLVNLLILYAGLFALFKLTSLFFKDVFWGYVLGILLFTSPILVYYGTNFLSDAPGFCFALIGLWQFFRFYENKRLTTFYLALFFLLMGSLLKITAAMSLITITGIYFLELVNWAKFGPNRKLFGHIKWKALFGFALVYLVLVSWYLTAIWYNKQHNTDYFSTRTWPIWNLSAEHIGYITYRLTSLWTQFYFHPITVIFLGLLMIVLFLYQISLAFKRAIQPLLFTFMFALFAGVVGYSMLWYFAYQDHDYYLVNTLIFVVSLLLMAVWVIKEHLPHLDKSIIFRILVMAFVVFNLWYGRIGLKNKYAMFEGENAYYAFYMDEFKPYLRSLGIKRTDKVITLPDGTPNMTLYLMNQPGWSQLYCRPMQAACVNSFIELGAKYIIVSDDKVLESSEVAPFLSNQIGVFEGVRIFEIPTPSN